VAVIDTFRAFTTGRRRPGERRIAYHHGRNGPRKRWRYVRPIAAPFAWGRSEGRRRPASITGIRRLRSPQSISAAGPIIQRTSAGTQGVVAASAGADRLYAASLVTAEATVRALLSVRPARSRSSNGRQRHHPHR